MDFLIVALGNPGPKYETTRHNVGWMALDEISEKFNSNWKEKFKGLYTQDNHKDHKVFFLKPLTYMNLSGESVQALCKFFKIEVENILVLHDEVDLPFGKIMFKDGGGLAGHNGLKSINQMMGSNNFKRLRMGIGRPERGDMSSHVLSNFSVDENAVMDDYLELSTSAVLSFLDEGFSRAAGKFSKKSIIEKD